MLNKSKKLVTGIMLTTIIGVASLTGCSTTDTTQSSSAGQSTTNPSTQPGAPGQPPGNANIDAVLERAAEILGVSSEDFIAAFQNAMPEPQSGEQTGEMPAPPTDQGEQGQMPPQGQQGQQPPAPPDGQGPAAGGMSFMTDIYAKMADELGLSADDIAAAMEQAQTELQNQ